MLYIQYNIYINLKSLSREGRQKDKIDRDLWGRFKRIIVKNVFFFGRGGRGGWFGRGGGDQGQIYFHLFFLAFLFLPLLPPSLLGREKDIRNLSSSFYIHKAYSIII